MNWEVARAAGSGDGALPLTVREHTAGVRVVATSGLRRRRSWFECRSADSLHDSRESVH
jgi:hypothetical protein